MYSPVRMCQPTSPSTSKPVQPADPLMNTHPRIATKNRSESEGMASLAQRFLRTDSMLGVVLLRGRTAAMASGEVTTKYFARQVA